MDHWELGNARSEPIEVDPAVPHVVEIWMGSLFPPAEDPTMAAMPVYLRTQLKNLTRVTLDGREVFAARGASHDAPPETLDLGANSVGLSSCAAQFSGDILRYSRPPALGVSLTEVMKTQLGPVRLTLKFPTGRVGLSEPLLAVGKAGQGDTVFAWYLDARTVRFTYEHQGAAAIASDPVTIDFTREHVVEIDFGALHPVDAGVEQMMGARREKPVSRLRVGLDGQSVWSADVDHYPSHDAPMTVGENPVGGLSGLQRFSGVIYRIERPDHPAASGLSPLADYGPVRLRVVFPHGKIGRAEPLLVTGHTGAADALIVRYADHGHVQFQWDHWGFGGERSGLVAMDYERSHDLEIDMGSLYPTPVTVPSAAAAEPAPRRNELTVKLGGVEVFSARGAFYPSTTAELALGANAIGLSSATAEFTGVIEQVSRPGVAAK
jgi:hypothetical protein